MGQQQLLLITLGVIIVGIAVVTGLILFEYSSNENKKNQIKSEGANLATMAQKYYRLPITMGGGGRSFVGWTIPALLDTTDSGVYSISSVSTNNLVITGLDRMMQLGQDTIRVTVQVTESDYMITENN
ncbi:MAG: hypothetical protein IPI12_08610 [Ignavibacteriales bacterium]|jgi:hypothetical protein|nr:hypothetical protein [Ignavibacteriales bacterium]MBP7542087.1 hypothetical protein [Ignavibacteriaceae bacterium]MBK7266380.1 hypothetical protein [Ignavibacteriales bacterium]MBK8661907.1 hypothetical protein [Ignavibacteriales bacterium]MBP9123021.1 hypothetical protein [Ignavibacteriaceae bacterium]